MTLHLFPTATDGVVDLSNPHYEQMNVLDIGWHLSQLNRFYGACLRPYSVAEHSLLVADILQQQGLDAHAQMAGLMHDAHEAYCNDLHPYTKRVLGWAWTNHERMLERTVRTAFWLHTAFDVHCDAVMRADKQALAAEIRDLRCRPGDAWADAGGLTAPPWVQLATPERAALSWEHWRDTFVDRFYDLEAKRHAALGDDHFPAGTGDRARREFAQHAANL